MLCMRCQAARFVCKRTYLNSSKFIVRFPHWSAMYFIAFPLAANHFRCLLSTHRKLYSMHYCLLPGSPTISVVLRSPSWSLYIGKNGKNMYIYIDIFRYIYIFICLSIYIYIYISLLIFTHIHIYTGRNLDTGFDANSYVFSWFCFLS